MFEQILNSSWAQRSSVFLPVHHANPSIHSCISPQNTENHIEALQREKSKVWLKQPQSAKSESSMKLNLQQKNKKMQ